LVIMLKKQTRKMLHRPPGFYLCQTKLRFLPVNSF
jgi:hypothetical protein